MIDDARALRNQVTNAAQLAESEAARLWAFAAELDAFIESAGDSADGAAPDAAPNSSEPPVDPPRRRAPGTTREQSGTDHGRRPSRPKSAGSIPASRSTSPAASIVCPDCRESFKPNGYGPHRAKKHRLGADKYLCSRNCGRSFLSRDGVRKHEAEASCAPKATPPPANGSMEFGHQRFSTRSGGFGQ